MSYMEAPRNARAREENDERCSALAMVALIVFFIFFFFSGHGVSASSPCWGLTGSDELCASGLPPYMGGVVGSGGSARYGNAQGIPCFKRGQVLLAVRGAAVSSSDVAAVAGGSEVPLGSDVSGVVMAAACDELAAGHEVMGLAQGSFAQFAVADCNKLAKRDVDENARVSLLDLGALPTAAGSMYEVLVAAGAPWSTAPAVVIANGASATGVYGVQLAKALGAGSVTTASPESEAALLRSLGADVVVGADELAAVSSAVDVAVDNGGVPGFAESEAVSLGGSIFRSAGRLVTLGKDEAASSPATFAALLELVASGQLTPVIKAKHILTDVPAALDELAAGAAGSTMVEVSLATCGTFGAHWSAEGAYCPSRGASRICSGRVGGGPAPDGMGGIAFAQYGLCMCYGRCWDALHGTAEQQLDYWDRASCPPWASTNCIYA